MTSSITSQLVKKSYGHCALRVNTTFLQCPFIIIDVMLYISEENSVKEEPRVLGLAMIPGHHIVTIEVDVNKTEPPAV